MVGFLDEVFGVDDARNDLARGRQQADKAVGKGAEAAREDLALAREALATGAETARGDLTTGRDAALDFLGADIEAGDAARETTLAALGLRGRDAQADFFNNFEADPGFEASLQAGIDTIDQSAAARGSIFSGGTQKDLVEFGQRAKFDQFRDRLDRLTSLSAVGSRARAGAADVETGTGSALADVAFGAGAGESDLRVREGDLEFTLGQLKANNAIGFNTAIADTRGAGINNLARIVTEGAKAAAGFAGGKGTPS